ncbi:MAG: carbohydrate-binding domain-containing protein, partial [Eubacterium sp.]|nr:carbohydrate-binding domain-containing protein [Eubacterium sp.]
MNRKTTLPRLHLALLTVLLVGIFLITGHALAAENAVITFTDTGITGTGSGYSISGTALSITENGTYTITGSCSEGSISVAKSLDDVTLIFNDLTLSSSTTAPVVVKKSSTVTLTLVGSSTLSDLEDASTEDTNSDFEGAAIKVKSGSTTTIKGTGTLNIDAENCKNGIKGAVTSTVAVTSGTINVNAAGHAIAADGTVDLSGGTFNLVSGNEGIKASPDEEDTESAGVILISGGTFDINAADDGIHGDNAVTITGGTFTINAGDDAIKSDYVTTIGTSGSTDGPTINVVSSCEGIEGAVVNFYSGTGTIVASDDGVNAANSDLSGYSFLVNIAGGTWTVNSACDGIDSNKDITISGGKTEIFGSTNGGNAAFDYDGTATLTGGSILAVGNSGMAQTVTNGLSLVFGNVSVNKGTTIVIKDSSNNIVYSTTGV